MTFFAGVGLPRLVALSGLWTPAPGAEKGWANEWKGGNGPMVAGCLRRLMERFVDYVFFSVCAFLESCVVLFCFGFGCFKAQRCHSRRLYPELQFLT